jgi:quinol monooxygenase YgiN
VLVPSFVAQLSIRLLAPAGHAREISQALSALARRARRDRACVSSEVYESVDDQNRLRLEAEWTDAGDLAHYVRSDDFADVLALLEMAAEPPVLQFRLAGVTRALDYVAELRRGEKPKKA